MRTNTDFQNQQLEQLEQVESMVRSGKDISEAARTVFGSEVKYYRKVPKEIRDEIRNIKQGYTDESALVRFNVTCTVGQLYRLRERVRAEGKSLNLFISALIKQELNKSSINGIPG